MKTTETEDVLTTSSTDGGWRLRPILQVNGDRPAEEQVLIVEDEPSVAQNVRGTLERAGYGVPAIAASGAEAIAHAEAFQPDLVLMDITLPGTLGGIEAAHHLRFGLDVPVVYLGAYGDASTMECALSTEPFGFVLDPQAGQQLLAAVQVALKQHAVNRRQSEETAEQLRTLRKIDLTVNSSLDLRLTFDIFLSQLVGQHQVDAASVLLLDPYAYTLEYAAGHGFQTPEIGAIRQETDEGLAGRAVQERTLVSVSDLAAEDPSELTQLWLDEDFVAYHAVPLVADESVKGVLETFHRTPFTPSAAWMDFLETVASQVARAIDRIELVQDVQRSNAELTRAYDATIAGWARALELRDDTTEGHTQRVADMTVCLARAMGLPEEKRAHMRRGALLHDIGKISIPDRILLKPDKPTAEEWEIIKQHPTHAYEMLSPIEFLRPALDIPYCHHERWDGSGYPRGLEGEQIPLAARIFAVVDVWDALCSPRPYAEPWDKERARDHIREEAGHHFDPDVVDVFLTLDWDDCTEPLVTEEGR